MRAPLTFSLETKQRLVHLLIEALTEDLLRTEEELMDVLTRPTPPQPKPLGYTDLEPNLRMAISNLTEDRRLLQAVKAIPETSASVAEVFSVVRTHQGGEDTWYFITPCQYFLDREVRLDERRIRCVWRQHFLMGTRQEDTYTSGGSWDIYTGKMFEAPLVHHVIDLF